MNDSGDGCEQFVESVIERIDAGVFVVDENRDIMLWNRFMEWHSGRKADDVCGKNLFECFPELPQKWLEKKFQSIFLLKNYAFISWKQRPYIFRFVPHRPITGGIDAMRQNCTLIPIKRPDGEVQYVCVTLIDATETCIYQNQLQETLESLERVSQMDGLTGLYNRRYFERLFAAEVQRFIRYNQKLCFALFDLDHFKGINDSFGHPAGDEVLRVVSQTARQTLRETDICGRYGGEEFAVIMPGVDLAGGRAAMERLRSAVAGTRVPFEKNQIAVTVSIGVAATKPGLNSHEELVQKADGALYRAKQAGRNRTVCSDEDP